MDPEDGRSYALFRVMLGERELQRTPDWEVPGDEPVTNGKDKDLDELAQSV